MFPFALEDIGWKTYKINGTWDVFVWVYLVVLGPDQGHDVDEIDEVMDEVRHFRGAGC